MADIDSRFDETVYLAFNPDVAAALKTGQISSGEEHFRHHGYREGRVSSLPVDFDEVQYLLRNVEAGAAVKAGKFASGGVHFLKIGNGQRLKYLKSPEIREEIINTIWRGRDPFVAFPSNVYAFDLQGWNSEHEYLGRAVGELRPKIVVEIGVWKGGSTITMAKALRDLKINGIVIAIDTWLGSSEHWLSVDWFGDLGFESGYPKLYHRFMNNVVTEGLEDYIVPLPIDSLNAQVIFEATEIRPDVIHIDAGHDYRSVMSDLTAWWRILKPGGLLIADDYLPGQSAWPGVLRAVDEFFASNRPDNFEAVSGKAMARKPGSDGTLK